MKQLMKFFSPQSAEDIARKELAQAQRELLQADSHREYATRMAEYQRDRIRRLAAMLQATRGQQL